MHFQVDLGLPLMSLSCMYLLLDHVLLKKQPWGWGEVGGGGPRSSTYQVLVKMCGLVKTVRSSCSHSDS